MNNHHPENQYLDLLKDILENGEEVENRTGINTLRVLGKTMKFDFKYGFPLFTTKRTWFKGIAHELLWFLSGSTNISYLVKNGVNIWNDDAWRHYQNCVKKYYYSPPPISSKEEFLEVLKQRDINQSYEIGDLGPVYGKQWRSWTDRNGYKIDQIANLIDGLKNNPSSRRHILSAWNVADIEDMALPPCHLLAQFTISKGKLLWCQMYQRSCDTPLGVPYNVASYSLLTYMIAQVCGLEPGGFIWTGHDTHIYKNQIPGILEQIKREPLEFPTLWLNPERKNIDDFTYEDIKVVDYQHHEKIDMPLSTGA